MRTVNTKNVHLTLRRRCEWVAPHGWFLLETKTGSYLCFLGGLGRMMIWSGKPRRNQRVQGLNKRECPECFHKNQEIICPVVSFYKQQRHACRPSIQHIYSPLFLPYVEMTKILPSVQTNTSPFKFALMKCQWDIKNNLLQSSPWELRGGSTQFPSPTPYHMPKFK